MAPLFIYLLKVNIALVLFYLAYRYGLRRLTFYTLNRFYLLFAIGFSSLYPLIDLKGFIKRQQAAGNEIIYHLPDFGSMATESSLQLWSILEFVFWSGVAIMAIRFLVQFFSLARLHFASRRLGDGKPMQGKSSRRNGAEREPGRSSPPVIRIVKEKINPFSFFRSIYINPLLHSPAERLSVIGHEQVHVTGWHTLDILAGELNRIFYWFNPGAWLMMTAIRENLEFIADRKVLKGGVDAKDYQYSLIRVSKIAYASSLANNFNFSHLKIRITMMEKKPSSELHLVKYLVLVPFLAVVSLAFNLSGRSAKEAAPEMAEKPAFPVLDSLTGDSSEIVAWDVFRKEDTAGFFPTPPSKSIAWEKVLFIVDGKKIRKGKDEILNIDPENIAYLDMLKGQDAVSAYGQEGKDGVIIIKTKKGAEAEEGSGQADSVSASARRRNPVSGGSFGKIVLVGTSDSMKVKHGPKPGERVSSREIITLSKGNALRISYDSSKSAGRTIVNGDKALILIDGKESDYETMQQLTEGEIHTRTIISGKAAAEEYGKKGEYGVIKITSNIAKK